MFVKLVTARRLDHEVMNETSVTLTCTDHGQQALTSDVTLTVHVLDINDNAPRFDVTSYSADVVENSVIGTFVTQVSAVDDDDGDSGLVHYIIGNKLSSELEPETVDYGWPSRQKAGKRRNGGKGGRRGRIQRHSVATPHLGYSEMYRNQTEQRWTSETEVRRSGGTSGGHCVGRISVDKHSGVVTVVGLIDFEYSAVFNCQILAIDSGSPPKTGDHFYSTLQYNTCV